MKLKLFLFASFLFTSVGFGQEMPVLVELYTSQGCSSCPPADKLLEEVAKTYGEKVIVMAYHVDYWDYIGWEDPFASKQFTEKQYAFAKANNSRNVYTPQAVINQQVHFTGSDKSKMQYYLKEYKDLKPQVDFSIKNVMRDENSIKASFTTSNPSNKITYTYAVTVAERSTAIERGENRNRILRDTHIVAGVQTLITNDSYNEIHLILPGWVKPEDKLSIVIYASIQGKGIIGVKSVAVL